MLRLSFDANVWEKHPTSSCSKVKKFGPGVGSMKDTTVN
jgi:hypothetical protein